MHCEKHDVNEVETMNIIIETCPDFMATQNKFGSLPVNCSSYDSSSAYIFVPLLADMGRQHGIGGDRRGGLLVDSFGFNTLLSLTENPSPDTFKALMNVEPPLFYKQDVHDHDILHWAVNNGHIEVVKFIIELDASCLYSSDKEDRMPIAFSYDSCGGKI
jgi:ankyrin repeat protein